MTGLDNTEHTILIINNVGTDDTVILFDYLVYTWVYLIIVPVFLLIFPSRAEINSSNACSGLSSPTPVPQVSGSSQTVLSSSSDLPKRIASTGITLGGTLGGFVFGVLSSTAFFRRKQWFRVFLSTHSTGNREANGLGQDQRSPTSTSLIRTHGHSSFNSDAFSRIAEASAASETIIAMVRTFIVGITVKGSRIRASYYTLRI